MRAGVLLGAVLVSQLAVADSEQLVYGDPRMWPARGDWIVVTCTDDGKARYGIAPFVDAAPLDNAREACAAIRTALGD
ncbi:MAG TPA: hypothetical protein VMR65_07580 [Candidatus Sulfotelmatobacter sp.]|jgi:hypothetical protein|nr:hypothetical protein [Candidatus Sulfotelmatobacter sp.]